MRNLFIRKEQDQNVRETPIFGWVATGFIAVKRAIIRNKMATGLRRAVVVLMFQVTGILPPVVINGSKGIGGSPFCGDCVSDLILHEDQYLQGSLFWDRVDSYSLSNGINPKADGCRELMWQQVYIG